jgi:signal transduction histidine kinase
VKLRAFFGSMTGRVFITLLLGVLMSAALTQLAADTERQRVLEQLRYNNQVERSEQLIMATEIVPASARQAYLAVANRPGLRLDVGAPLPANASRTEFANTLAARLGKGYQVQSSNVRPASCDLPHHQPALYGLLHLDWHGSCETINVRLRDGEDLRLAVLPPRAPNGAGFEIGWIVIVLFLVSIAVLAYLVARMTTRPLKQLAQAAKDLGQDINHAPLELAGASEIRQASAAFNAMQARIRQYIFQRTQMLAAITHDLQTPLTRMRLRLEKVGDRELQERLIGDLSAMQAMVREGLVLARSMDTTEAMQMLDLDSLLDSVCADAVDAHQQVNLSGRANMALLGRPLDLRRCLVNLIDNAVKYGHQASVAVDRVGGAARIRIRDKGPGIADAELARVFEPFYRIEGSRSRESGGTGLGLTIARNIAEQHGGSITLANHPDGGLEVILVLPEHYPGQ